MKKPHIIKVEGTPFWEAYWTTGNKLFYSVGTGLTPYEAWMYCVWGHK